MTDTHFASGRVLVVAFEGWNDAGEAASSAVRALRDLLDLVVVADVDPEEYFDYQFNRPTISTDDEGVRELHWPSVTIFGPSARVDENGQRSSAGPGDTESNLYLLVGTEPSRGWKKFVSEVMDVVTTHGIESVILLGAMLADVPHSRPISIFTGSESRAVRERLGVERSGYEGPVGILSVLGDAVERAGLETMSVWASVPHYVHNAPSPKATLAMLEKLEVLIGIPIPRGDLVEEAKAWETGIDALAGDDEDMASYIEQLEQARDTVDSPEASGDAIAEEFERYFRRSGDKPEGGSAGEGPWRPKD